MASFNGSFERGCYPKGLHLTVVSITALELVSTPYSGGDVALDGVYFYPY